MKIAVVTTDKVGISTTLVGEQVIAALTAQGHEVVPVYTDGRAGTPINCKPLSKLPVICLLEHKTAQILDQVRYSRPKCVLSVWTGNVEGYTLPAMLSYASLFLKPKLGGVPIRHVSHSHHTATKLRELAGSYFKASICADIDRNCVTHLYGVDTVFQPGLNDPDTLVAPMNRIVQGSKNVGLHAEITSKYQIIASQRGWSPATTFYFAPGFGPDDKQIAADLSVYHFEQQPDSRADYVQNAARTGMFLSCSNFESFGIYYLELLCSGAVGVFLDKPWVNKLLPGYPYIVPKNQLVSALIHVRQDYENVRRNLLESWVPLIRERYSLDRFAAGLVQEIETMDL